MKSFNFILGLLATFLITSCGPTTNPTTSSPSIDPTVEPTTSSPTSEDPTSIEPTSSGPIVYLSLDEVITATENNYSLVVDSIGREVFIEAYTKDLYINSMNRVGFIELDSDPGYAHQSEVKLNSSSDTISYYIDVYGRVGPKSVINFYKDRAFFSIIRTYLDTFVDKGEGKHVSNSTEMAYELKDFFQNNGIKYCNEFIFRVNSQNELEYFECYEAGTIIYSFKFYKTNDKNDVELYKNWKNNGSKVIERLVDYKFLYQTNPIYEPISVYEGEEVTFEGIVSSTDTDGNLYVGTFDENYGYISMKVEGKASDFEELDTVKVTGTIKTSKQTAYIEKATVIDLGKKGEFLPVYDEEALVDLNGGGTYAVNLFLNNPPVFASSIYSTYAYIKSYEEQSSSEDTVVTLLFDSYRDSSNNYYTPNLIIPGNLSSDKKDEIYKVLKEIELYGSKNAVELSIEKVIVEFDPTSTYGLNFIVTEHSVVGKKMSASEKIEKHIGLEGFPILGDVKTFAFTFGGFQGMILEDYYGISNYDEATKGLFISYEDLDIIAAYGYLNLLTEYGYKLIEEVKDVQGRRHKIYQLQDSNSYLAITIIADDYDENMYSIEMWVYNHETPLLPKSIEEKLEEVASDIFSLDEFTRKSGSFAADYNLFELDTYAGKVYKDDPLVVLTLNTEEASATNYAKQLISEKGYKQHRVNGYPYSYTTRGQAHLVLISPEGTFVDLACYPTTDYTYYGHKEFKYRIEAIIYDAEEPLSVKTYDNLDILVDNYSSVHSELDYTVGLTLPDDVVIEYWKDTGLKNIDYGYGCIDEVFIYSDSLDVVWNNLIEAILANGYTKSVQNETRASFSRTINSEGFYLAMLYEPEKGYVRLMHNVLGASFF